MEKVAFYPGCSLEGIAREYGESLRKVLSFLGVEIFDLPDWSCCGASAGHSTDAHLWIELPKRNVLIAEKVATDVVVACCACFNRLKEAEIYLRDHEAYEPRSRFVYINEFLVKYTDKIRQLKKVDLSSLKVVPYYGCQSVRPPKVTGVKDYEDPKSMDYVIEACGATCVKWSFKTDCCGGSLVVSRPEIVDRLCKRLLDMAKEAGAEMIVTDCPLCQSNLDTRQAYINKKYNTDFNIPIIYITELVGIACGIEETKKWLKRNIVDPIPLLKEKNLIN